MRERGCRAPVLLVSGFDPDGTAAEAVDRGEAELLRKPYLASELVETVAALLAAPGPSAGPALAH